VLQTIVTGSCASAGFDMWEMLSHPPFVSQDITAAWWDKSTAGRLNARVRWEDMTV
jgi:hypothetical protein